MRLDVRYFEGAPAKITSKAHGHEHEYRFTIEDETARLIDVRLKQDRPKNASGICVSELNDVHDAILRLPFIDRVTVWMNGRTDEQPQQPADDDAQEGEG